MNARLRGWTGYFHYRNSNGVLEKVKGHAEERFRKHLMKRHKVKDRRIGLGRSRASSFMRNMGCTRFRQRLAGKQRMPWCEEHRKAVGVNSACTV